MEKNKNKTVFFGPFVGEFGWELLFWHGWVKRKCRTRYKDYRKIVCSFPGRYPFYSDADEFMPLPSDFLKNPISSRSYITDCWINGYPKPSIKTDLPDIFPLISQFIDKIKKGLPENTEYIFPWAYRYDEDDKKYYGIKIKESPSSDSDFELHGIPYHKQILEQLKPTAAGVEAFKKINQAEGKIIAIFPRNRRLRRPDKDWPKEKYQELIIRIQNEFPDLRIAILGEPEGSFFSEKVPEGCIDLININQNLRMDIHLAALKQTIMALGSQSGAISFSLASGAKTISWGPPEGERVFNGENFTGSPFVFLPYSNPSVETVFRYMKWFLGSSQMPIDNLARIINILFYRIFNPRYPFLIKSRISGTFKIWKKEK